MEDEACVYYEDMINNMMIDHEFVEKEFGVRPREDGTLILSAIQMQTNAYLLRWVSTLSLSDDLTTRTNKIVWTQKLWNLCGVQCLIH